MKSHPDTTPKSKTTGKAQNAATKASAPEQLCHKDQEHKASGQTSITELEVNRDGPLSLAAVSQLIQIIRKELMPLDLSTTTSPPGRIGQPCGHDVAFDTPKGPKNTLLNDALEMVNGRLDFAFKLVHELKEKADPVLRPEPSSMGAVANEKERPPMPPAVASIHEFSSRLDYLNAILNDLVERIEA